MILAVLNPLKRNISSMMIQGVEQEAYTYARAYRSLWNDRGSYRETVANVSHLSRSVPTSEGINGEPGWNSLCQWGLDSGG